MTFREYTIYEDGIEIKLVSRNVTFPKELPCISFVNKQGWRTFKREASGCNQY